jgi:Toprim domain-containing protein
MASRLQDLLITDPERAWRITEGTADWDLEEIADLLDGETSGRRFVLCPSPGRSWDDRSMKVIFDDPRRPSKFYIYDCEGPHDAAIAHVRERLRALPDAPPRDYSKSIRRIREDSVLGSSAAGWLVEKYLRSRAITLPIPPSLKYNPRLYHTETESHWPGMVAERTDPQGRFVTIHRTFLSGDGRKAPVEPTRKDMGPPKGSGILLAAVAEEMLVGEGIETVLSGMRMSGFGGIACGVARNLRDLLLPPAVRRVRILVDGDEHSESAAKAAAARWYGEGRQVAFARAPAGLDFNDLLLGEGPVNG